MALDRSKLLGTQSGGESTSTVLVLLRATRKNWPILVACLALAAGISLVYSRNLTRVYQAAAMIELDPSVTRPLSEKMDNVMPLGSPDYYDTREYYETQYRILTSSKVMEAAA